MMPYPSVVVLRLPRAFSTVTSHSASPNGFSLLSAAATLSLSVSQGRLTLENRSSASVERVVAVRPVSLHLAQVLRILQVSNRALCIVDVSVCCVIHDFAPIQRGQRRLCGLQSQDFKQTKKIKTIGDHASKEKL
jgi:hypothetical protein